MLDYCCEQEFSQIHTATPGPIGLAALAVAKILKLPLTGTYHTSIPQYAPDSDGGFGDRGPGLEICALVLRPA
jgi:hypothetical protein